MNQPYFHFTGGLLSAIILLVILFFLFVFLPVSVVSDAFSRLGMTPAQGVLMLLALLLGRGVNVPVYTSKRLVMVHQPSSASFGFDDRGNPVMVEQGGGNELKPQVFALNVGGAILPLLLTITFLLQYSGVGEGSLTQLLGLSGLCTILVAAVSFAAVRSDPFTGLRLPFWVPVAATVVAVLLFAPEPLRPLVAWISGTLGAVLGGNVAPMLLPSSRNRMAVPLVAIGGAGIFGSVLLAGIIGAVLA